MADGQIKRHLEQIRAKYEAELTNGIDLAGMIQREIARVNFIERFAESRKILGVSHPIEATNPYADMSIPEFFENAETARQILQMVKNGTLSAVTVYRLVNRIAGKSTAGRRGERAYSTAFERVYILKTHSLQNAFAGLLIEEQITPSDESDRADRWNAFNQAMKRLRKKFSI